MTSAWWDDPAATGVVEADRPVLMPGGRAAAITALQQRISGFVPEWRDLGPDDAGVALVRLFGAQLEPVLNRVERLPDKLLREFLSSAGICQSAPRSAQATVQFVPVTENDSPVEVPARTRLSSPRADGEQGEVIWETTAPLTVANCALAEILTYDGESARAAENGTNFKPFGDRPEVGTALYLGFTASGYLAGILSLGVEPYFAGPASPVSAGPGGTMRQPAVRLVWEALTDRGFVQIDVDSDDTGKLTQSGKITLAIPSNWQTGRPSETGDGENRNWLRLRIASGELTSAPNLLAIHPHVTSVSAQETVREEYPVPKNDERGKYVELVRTPVVSGSVVLEVAEGVASANLFDMPQSSGDGDDKTSNRLWKEMESLAGATAEARVFTLDPITGEIRFGNNINGLSPPPGIRNIAVRSYAVTLGAAGNVAAGDISKLVSNIPGIDTVENLKPAIGGVNSETVAAAEQRGPAQLKARGRAVTLTDMELLAQESAGANIIRAYAISGVDPSYPGAEIPGTVGIFVIARRHPTLAPDEPPYADSVALKSVAHQLSGATGPLGARVAVGNPRYHEVRVEGAISVAAGADAGSIITKVRTTLDRWLNPENTGPDSGQWTIGATLRHIDLSHLVLSADDRITSIPYLAFRVDGISYPACSDVPLSRFGLPWPGRHRILAEAAGDQQ